MLQPVHHDFEESIKYAIKLEHCQLAPNVHVYRKTVSRSVISVTHETSFFSKGKNPEVVSDFVNDENLALLLAGKDYKDIRRMYLVTKQARSQILRKRTDALHGSIQDPYGALLGGGSSLDCVFRWDTDDNMIYDIEGNPVPQGIHFEYMNGKYGTCNKYYDLKKLADILVARDDVEILVPSYMGSTTKDPKKAIQSIPQYNADEEDGKTHYIDFVWYPSVEDYRRVFDKANSYKKDECFWQSMRFNMAMFDLDILGMRAAFLDPKEDY